MLFYVLDSSNDNSWRRFLMQAAKYNVLADDYLVSILIKLKAAANIIKLGDKRRLYFLDSNCIESRFDMFSAIIQARLYRMADAGFTEKS